jgi:lipoprotein-anchoring transpeptidase ErfK/SrfK
MRSRVFIAALAACAAPLPATAQAFLIDGQPSRQVVRQVATTGSIGGPPPGAYGGGFIELLMTGRDPTPYVRPGVNPVEAVRQPQSQPNRRAAPAAAPAQPFWDDPMASQQPSPRQMAAIAPRAAVDSGIGRAIPPEFQRQEVAYSGRHAPGTVVIDTNQKFLFLVQGDGRALRYGIGVGRPGFEWAGAKTVTRKAEWPDWRPPAQMLKRRPDLPRFMAGGQDNPLGARALYLGSSLYRIHGTNEPHTIGQAVSSGCIRMTNDDVIDLYNRVRVGSRVIVM